MTGKPVLCLYLFICFIRKRQHDRGLLWQTTSAMRSDVCCGQHAHVRITNRVAPLRLTDYPTPDDDLEAAGRCAFRSMLHLLTLKVRQLQCASHSSDLLCLCARYRKLCPMFWLKRPSPNGRGGASHGTGVFPPGLPDSL